MAKQVTVEKPVVNRNAVNALSNAITHGLTEVNKSGSLLTQVCEVARKLYKGEPIPECDVTEILNDLVTRMKWKRGSVADSRRSEYKAVLMQYALLDEAMKKFRAATGYCKWHDGIALARLLKNNTISKAVSKHATRGSSKGSPPKNSSDAKKRAAMSIKSVLKLPHLPRAFLSQLRALCAEYELNV